MDYPDDMPWVNLSQQEVEDLRNKKHELTEYGKQKLRELIYKEDMRKMEDAAKDLVLKNLTHEEMLEEAERREKERKALDALDKLYDENGDALQRLAAIEKEEWEQKQRSRSILQRYNDYYNMECASLPHGTPITPEHQQMIAFQSMIDAIRCEHLNEEYTHIAISDIEDLIERLDEQARKFLERVRKNNG